MGFAWFGLFLCVWGFVSSWFWFNDCNLDFSGLVRFVSFWVAGMCTRCSRLFVGFCSSCWLWFCSCVISWLTSWFCCFVLCCICLGVLYCCWFGCWFGYGGFGILDCLRLVDVLCWWCCLLVLLGWVDSCCVGGFWVCDSHVVVTVFAVGLAVGLARWVCLVMTGC